MHVQNLLILRGGFDHMRGSRRRTGRSGGPWGAQFDDTPRMEGFGILVGLALSVPLWFAIGWTIMALSR